MNFNIIKITALSVFILCTALQAIAQSDSLESEITLRAYLEHDNVPLNKEVVYHVELSWRGDLDQYQISDIGDPSISNLTLRGSGSTNRVTTNEQGHPLAIKKVTFYFKPVEIGMAYVDGVTIGYTNRTTNTSETLLAQRLSVKIVEPTEDPKNEFMPGNIVLWSLLIGFILVVAYFVFRYMQRRNKTEETEEEISLEQKYLSLLAETVHLSNGASRENIAAMRKLLNSYVSEKFSIPGNVEKEITKDRLAKLKIPADFLAKIEQMYDKAELAQFAGEQVETTELHLFFDTIEHILKEIDTSTKMNSGKKE